MKILVTGGCGFIGSALIRKALSNGYSVSNVDCLTYAGSLYNLTNIEKNKLYEFNKVDITNIIDLKEVVNSYKPMKIIHLAAESHVDRSIDNPNAFMQTNIIGTFNLLEVALEYWNETQDKNFVFHHVSTDEVFGSLGTSGLFSEDSSYLPNSPYAASKASSDHIVRAWNKTFRLPIVISNCSNNYGPYQFPEKFIPLVILNAIQGKKIPIYGNGENIRDWLYVEDHAEALIEVFNKGKQGRSYNIGGNNELKNIDLAKKICDILDKKVPKETSYSDLIEFVEDRPGHDERYAIDSSRILNELGWKPKNTFEQGLDRTVTWYLNNNDWINNINQKNLGKRLGTSR